MKVITYAAIEPQTNPHLRYVARLQMSDGAMGTIIFTGSDPDKVQAEAEAWWEKATTRAGAKRAPKKVPSPVVDDEDVL